MGVPMPFFFTSPGALHPRSSNCWRRSRCGGRPASGVADAQHQRPVRRHLADYVKIKDTIDVWFDSGCTHQTVMGGPDSERTGSGSHRRDTRFPADLYLEGSDQHRGWFQSSLLVSCMLNGVPPYKALLTHGFAVDGEGRKMSKSKGNGVEPQKVSNTLGAEILRLWVASTDLGELSSPTDPEARREGSAGSYAALPAPNTWTRRAGAVALPDLMGSTARLAATRAMCGNPEASTLRVSRGDAAAANSAEDLGGFYLDVLKDRLRPRASRRSRRRRWR
jgi:isoleucyl-tRNA synthetase